jgi:peptidoglycan hydrolase-like protein with peptidoglycan-binding domain
VTLQQALAELGYLMGESDGNFGAETHIAVVDWQLENGYTPNGEISEDQLSVLLRQTPVPGAIVNRGKPACVKATDGLTLRSEPNAKSKQLDILRNGTIVRVLDETNGWYKIRIGSQTGYAAAKYIKITENNSEVN